MISSTSVDLPEHRQQVVDACLRKDFFPKAMERLPARDADAIRISLEMVDEADIYIGIFAWRYGHVPAGHGISITEMEYQRAVERGIPILVFLIHKEHSLTIEMVEADKDAQKKLEDLKSRASAGRGRREFRSAEELRSEVIHALGDYKLRAEQAAANKAAANKAAPSFHPPSLIPRAPQPYIAHPYSLLQTAEVIGRRDELKLLTDWITKNEHVPADTRIFSVVAIGGMGKSALTWKWFEDIAPNELPNLAGRLWWSFYESDAHWENFTIRALAYTAAMPEAKVRQLSPSDREELLFAELDTRPFLLVLDGLERILLAYARMDAAYLPDDDLDEQTANALGSVGVPPESSGISPRDAVKSAQDAGSTREKNRLRQCADLRSGAFLRKLTRVRTSRVLLSTRLRVLDLETDTGQPRPGCFVRELCGLTDDGALALWRGFIGGERSGTSEQLLPLFRAFGNYPLLLRALAGEVAKYRPAPGDFDRWRKDHPDFNPAALPLKNERRAHVLKFALRGLGDTQRRVLHTLAAFRMPATWDTLRALLTGDGRPCPDDHTLDAFLTELEDRGLVGWDKNSNRYDLHPIVRGVLWERLETNEKHEICTELHLHFEAAPVLNLDDIKNIEDLTTGIELFQNLVRLNRTKEALDVFRYRLHEPTLYRLSANRQRAELLEQLFPIGIDGPPLLHAAQDQSYAIKALALAYQSRGEPGLASRLVRRGVDIDFHENDTRNAAVGLITLCYALLPSGKIYEAENAVRLGLELTRNRADRFHEAVALQWLGLTLSARYSRENSLTALNRSLAILQREGLGSRLGLRLIKAFFAQANIWLCDPASALTSAQAASSITVQHPRSRDAIFAARLHGQAAMHIGDLLTSAERLQQAYNRARAVNLLEEEIPTLAALAELHRLRKEYAAARELLDQVWAPAERGPYPLWHADARNVLAQIERDLGNIPAAIEAATMAYELAWCDGPPYAYHYGLTNARRHLAELGVPEPRCEPFNESKFPPMPEVELNPHDEFHVEVET